MTLAVSDAGHNLSGMRSGRDFIGRWTQLLLALVVGACAGPPAQLAVGTADTVLVNSRRSVPLPVRLLDAKGRELRAKNVRFEQIAGDHVALTSDGRVTCPTRGDAVLRASMSGLTSEFVVLCRPVKGFRMAFDPDPPLVVGDPPRDLALGAVGVDDLPVNLLAGTATVQDSTIAGLRGLTIVPRHAGNTEIFVDIGDCVYSMFIEVAEAVRGSRDLARRDQLFTVPSLRLVAGEIRTWPIPRGEYQLWLRTAADAQPQLVLGGVSMNCANWSGAEQKYHCLAFDNAAVIVRNMQPVGRGKALEGALAIRRMDDAPSSAGATMSAVRRSPRFGKPFCRTVR